MNITKKRLKQIIKEELEIIQDEARILKEQGILPGDQPHMPRSLGIDPSLILKPVMPIICSASEDVQSILAQASATGMLDDALDEILDLVNATWVQKKTIKMLGAKVVLDLIQQNINEYCPPAEK